MALSGGGVLPAATPCDDKAKPFSEVCPPPQGTSRKPVIPHLLQILCISLMFHRDFGCWSLRSHSPGLLWTYCVPPQGQTLMNPDKI